MRLSMKASTRPSIEEGFAFRKYLFETAAYTIMAIHHSQNGSQILITHHFCYFYKKYSHDWPQTWFIQCPL